MLLICIELQSNCAQRKSIIFMFEYACFMILTVNPTFSDILLSRYHFSRHKGEHLKVQWLQWLSCTCFRLFCFSRWACYDSNMNNPFREESLLFMIIFGTSFLRFKCPMERLIAFSNSRETSTLLRDHRQISLVIWSEFKRIN